MDPIIFLAFAVAHLALLVWVITLAVRRGRLIVSDLAIPVVAALVYDNAIIGLMRRSARARCSRVSMPCASGCTVCARRCW